MKIDLDYMASLLKVFIDADTAHIDIDDIRDAGLTVFKDGTLSEIYLFHIQLAIDNQLIGKNDGPALSIRDIGIRQSLSGEYSIAVLPIRLTQRGHDFAATLNNKEVLTRLKAEFKDAPFKVIFDGGQQLLQFFLQKKLENLMQ